MEIKGAILSINPPRKVSSTFEVQEIYLDVSRYNNATGEKYDNAIVIQNFNSRVNVEGLKRGEMVTAEMYHKGRFYTKRDGTSGFMQGYNLAVIERVTNTANEFITLPEEQLMQVEIPQ